MSESSRHLAALLIEQVPKYFPPEKLQFFDETGGVGLEFSKLPFDHLIFTGSGQTGRADMAAAGQNMCPVTLELGGKAPEVVCDDFELDVAAEAALRCSCSVVCHRVPVRISPVSRRSCAALHCLQGGLRHTQIRFGKSKPVLQPPRRGSHGAQRVRQAIWTNALPTNSPVEAVFLACSVTPDKKE